MKRPLRYIRQHLSLRLGLIITLIIAVAFTLLSDILFERCRHFIQRAAIDHASQLLDNTAERITGIMDETELVTNFMARTVPSHLAPDSLLAYSRRGVEDYDFLTGLAISMERTSCWTDAFDDYNEDTLSSPDIMTSYCCPMRDAEGRYLGSITASLTLKWLSASVSALQPYPNSSAIMIGRDGTYLVHPDTAKLFRQTIFSDAAPESRRAIEQLGRAMIAGRSGMVETKVDGRDAFIFYRPLERTGWSIAIVCPENDVFARYYRVLAIVWAVIGIGLLLLLVVCYQTVRRAIQPLEQLDYEAQRIAEGHFDTELTESPRQDSIGRLQNSFIRMQQSLATSVNDIRSVNAELEQRNEELTRAYEAVCAGPYEHELIIQDFIPGGDDAIRSLTTFSDAQGRMRVVAGGRVALQDHSPLAIGNPVCILSEKVDAIIEGAERFLARVGYRGYANFDIKYDERDGSYRFFEVNTRPGRNTYYVSLGGVSFVRPIVDEFVLGREVPYREAYDPYLYTIVPPAVVKRSVEDPALRDDVLAAYRDGRAHNPLDYDADCVQHKLYAKLYTENQVRKFKKYLWDTGGKQADV